MFIEVIMRSVQGLTSFVQRLTQCEQIVTGVDHPSGQPCAGTGGDQPLKWLVCRGEEGGGGGGVYLISDRYC